MSKISYSGYRFPPEIIYQAIWLYLRFTLSLRDVEDLLAERGVAVSYETVRRWVNHFGPMIAADLRKRRPKPRTTWHLDEVYLKIDGRMVYLWRAVGAEGEVLDVLVQSKRNKHAALKLMRKLLKKYAFAPDRRRHVATRRARTDGSPRIFRLPRQPGATCSSPQCEACGAFGLKSDGAGR
jgi:putative transposase